MPLPCLCKVWSKFIEYFLIYIQLIVVVHILVKYLQTGHRVYMGRQERVKVVGTSEKLCVDGGPINISLIRFNSVP